MAEYPDFVKTCGFGSVTGILGANCRHTFHPFIPDVMERTYTDQQLEELKAKPFEYEGKQYDTYTATQQQRKIERTIRKWERRKAAAVNEKDTQTAQIRINMLKQDYAKFSKAAGLKTQAERMKAYVPKGFTEANKTAIMEKGENAVKVAPEPTFAEKIGAIKTELANGGDYDTCVNKAGALVAEEYGKYKAEISTKLAPLESQRDELTAQIKEAFNNREQERYQDLSDKRIALNKQINAIKDGSAEWLKGKLSEVREMGTDGVDLSKHFLGKSQDNPIVKSAYSLYPKEWVMDSLAKGNIKVRRVSRGYHQEFIGYTEIGISGFSDRGKLSTAIHELGHRFETCVKGIKEAEARLYAKRASGEDLKWLGKGYRRDEKSRFDKWLSPYMGKDYGGRAYEIVSMGFDYAYTNPAELARDEDFQKWIYGLLAIG